jgi:hypothetical protein
MNGAAVLALPKVSEQQILNSILEYLTLRRIPHAHVRNTGALICRNGRTFFATNKHRQPGVSDILACYKGRALAIEVKAPGGRLSEDQRDWLFRWEANGGGAFAVVYSADEVEKLLQKIDGRSDP